MKTFMARWRRGRDKQARGWKNWAADWLADAVRQFADNPVLKFIGAFDSGGLVGLD